ncbi:MAG: phage portal protein, partial [Peptostreptococcaceae bacterium]|nr:phage portal protein [Peptostreptococcaceae bacterium]
MITTMALNNSFTAKAMKQFQAGKELDSELLQELLFSHKAIAERQKHLYDMYTAVDLEIQHRKLTDDVKINNKLENDFYSLIINQCVGYLFGNGLVYSIDSGKYDLDTFKEYQDELFKWQVINNIADLDMETGKYQAVCGVAYRICYIADGEESVMNIKPWEIIPFEENGVMKYAIRYYKTYDAEGNEIVKVDFYDDRYVSEYVYKHETMRNESGLVLTNKYEHLFKYCPVISFENNEDHIGDFEKTITLVEAFNRLVSDTQNEIEEFRQAYMVFDNDAEIDKETIIAARQTGAFTLPEGSKAYFLTKDINPEFIQLQKEMLEENIYKFSQSVNMTDENFSGGTQTGESRKWKILDLENKAMVKERKFERALREQFKVLCSSWNVRGKDLKYWDIFVQFSRAIPKDLSYLADVVTKLKGIVSDRTLISLMPFVDDIDFEFEQREEELTSTYGQLYN